MYCHTAIYVSSHSWQAEVNIRAGVKLTKSSMLYMYVLMLLYMCPSCCDCIRQHTSAYVSIRQHTSVLMLLCTCPSYSGQVVVNISAGVKFTKSSMFQSKITNDTIKELGKTYTAWVQLAELVATGRCMRTHI